MNIVFLNGPFRGLHYSRSSRSPAVTKSGTIYYPLWLAYAAGLMSRRTAHNVSLLDAVVRCYQHADLIDEFRSDPPDLVFCDTSTPSITEDLATAAAIKNNFPNCRVVMVGTHATAVPQEIYAAEPRIDAVACGEYDLTAVELADALAAGASWDNIPGLALPDTDNTVRYTADRPLIDDLDSLPFVSETIQQHLRCEDYFFAAAQFPMVMMITSRGCPHRCQWCLYPQVMHRGKYRMRSAQSVADEFAYIADALPQVREIGIEDDLFTGNRKRVRDICNLLIEQKNRINFWCDTRVDLDLDTMRLLKAAGCRLLIVGFESGSQQTLDRINKGTQAFQAFDFMQNARQAGLLVHGCFVLGNPGEDEAAIAQTITFAEQLNPDTAQFFPMIVYPGTAMFAWARENQYLTTTDYRNWLTPDGLHNSILDLPSLPADRVVALCDQARRQFYLRRPYIMRKLRQSLLSPHEAKRNVKAFCRFARHLVRTA